MELENWKDLHSDLSLLQLLKKVRMWLRRGLRLETWFLREGLWRLGQRVEDRRTGKGGTRMFNFMLTAHLPFHIFFMKFLFFLFQLREFSSFRHNRKFTLMLILPEFLHLFCCTQGYIYFFLLKEPTYFYFHCSVMLLYLVYRFRNAATS